MGVWRDLLEEVALAGSTWTYLDEIIVAFNEGDHSEQHHALRPFGKGFRLQSDGSQQEVDPFAGGERVSCLGVDVENIRLRHLNGPQRVHLEGPPAFLLRDDAVIT